MSWILTQVIFKALQTYEYSNRGKVNNFFLAVDMILVFVIYIWNNIQCSIVNHPQFKLDLV